MTSDSEAPGRYASPPCMAAEVDPAYFDPLAVDPEQARDVVRWRRAERTRLRAERDALSVADRQAAGAAIVSHLADLLRKRFSSSRLLLLRLGRLYITARELPGGRSFPKTRS